MRLLPIVLAFSLSNAFAVQGVGEYFYGPDMAENIACQIAEEYARTDAIRNFLGEEFESSTNEACYNIECFTTRDSNSSVMGAIKKVNKKEIITSVEQGKKVCTVDLEADVERLENKIYFNAWTEQPIFRHGEEVNFFAVTNKVGYLHVFNYHSKKYHKILWSKPLPSGKIFTLSDTASDSYLTYNSAQEEISLSSDSISNSYREVVCKVE